MIMVSVALWSAQPAVASAQGALGAQGPPEVVTDGTAPPSGDWYGWEILAADFVATNLFLSHLWLQALSGTSDYWPLGPVGIASYLLFSPAVHILHGERGRAGWSLLARLGLTLVGPIVASVAASGSDGCEGDNCADVGPALIFGAAMVAGSLIDANGAYDSAPADGIGIAAALDSRGGSLLVGARF